jgi:hypothetical protein
MLSLPCYKRNVITLHLSVVKQSGNLPSCWRVPLNGQIHVLATLSLGNSPKVTLNTSLDGPQKQTGCSGE